MKPKKKKVIQENLKRAKKVIMEDEIEEEVPEMPTLKPKWALFIHNATIHRAFSYLGAYQKLIPAAFTAPYTPDMNPVEGKASLET